MKRRKISKLKVMNKETGPERSEDLTGQENRQCTTTFTKRRHLVGGVFVKTGALLCTVIMVLLCRSRVSLCSSKWRILKNEWF
jgi:hypothetical protein